MRLKKNARTIGPFCMAGVAVGAQNLRRRYVEMEKKCTHETGNHCFFLSFCMVGVAVGAQKNVAGMSRRNA